ncbi:Tim44 domain-containing protein [Thiohalocapsa marina]|uniref:Tim44 domain-containing protein n=1 Tax=Thiohalocapsa marina TaxID=424902 RepID=A0A5M8FQS9_9GAMM|nr:Tim44-like domain-containing protein [Thiohalocapsa marina]KAA6185601.1 Tim44 domain-containing protein [Thiohalocapsa marina]
MKTLIVTLMATLFAGALLLPDAAEAKRFGSGKSLGKQYSTPRAAPDRQSAQPSRQQAASQAAAQGAQKSGASRWLGPLAGLAAGGLLASMFFGDGFEGFQIMDFLIIALLVFGGFMLFRMLRRKTAGPAPAAAAAGYGGQGAAMPDVQAREAASPFGGTSSSMSGQGPVAQATSGESQAPGWFDAGTFADGAKTHFVRLQTAWDKSDFRDIREYTSPQLFAEIKRERESLGDAPNYTEVVTLNAELVSVQRDGDQVVASVRFTGLIREDENSPAKPLDEVWHVAHAWDSADGDWLINGIQQAG